MKTPHRILAAGLLAALCAAAPAAQAQAVQQQYQYPSAPSRDGSQSPPSTLRITETPGSTAVPIRDTPESVREYQRCREVSDRAAVSNEQMRAGVAQCLKELEARRQAG
ncbi:hypothetical protein QCN28_14395 [Bordetella bronchiseptica]|uniref:N-acetyltransferase YedL n=1 Tax=Bordetella genomosp. 6 TaxID=463024 RepID=A0ABX4FHE6_9BORD|nr:MULTISPECIES: hypothetical protein [Bordetella]KCV65811.1 hypothetical protein L493_3283 [Bordetella bronchiseptica 99-R-0433]OZI81581.1 hypothetical protein CAL23_07710 [Bordetella genomosp. 6]